MTTLPITSPTAGTRAPAAPSGAWRAGLLQTIRAEWTKLVSLRSTKWTLLITLVGTVLVTYLASDESAWVTGQNYSVDGGMTAGYRLPTVSGQPKSD